MNLNMCKNDIISMISQLQIKGVGVGNENSKILVNPLCYPVTVIKDRRGYCNAVRLSEFVSAQ